MASEAELRSRIRALEEELEQARFVQSDEAAQRLHLLESAEKLATVGSWVWDLRTGGVTWSRQLYRIFGIDPSVTPSVELFQSHLHPDDRERVQAGAGSGVEAGLFAPSQARIVRTDGVTREVLMQGRATLDPATGEPIRVYGSLQDITERVAAERARGALEAQLRQSQKMDALGRLASGVAHDLNNLLAVMLISVEGHHRRCTESGAGSLSHAIGAVESARDLTGRLLSFARRSEVQLKPTNVGEVVEGASTMLQRLLKPEIRLETEVDAATPLARADAHLLEQALMNLVLNARDAMPEGGTITVSVRAVEMAPSGPRSGPHVLLEIRDEGSGMEPTVLEHAIEPFFTTKAEGEGSGLGLSMVYGAITALQGHFDLSSAPGVGTQVSLFLPTV